MQIYHLKCRHLIWDCSFHPSYFTSDSALTVAEKVADDGPSVYSYTAHVRELDGVPSSCLQPNLDLMLQSLGGGGTEK